MFNEDRYLHIIINKILIHEQDDSVIKDIAVTAAGLTAAELLGDVLRGTFRKGKTFLRKHKGAKKLLIGSAVASLIFMISKQIYNRYFNRWARMCATAPDRKECIREAKERALNAQISTLRGNLSKCSKSSNPEDCRKRIQSMIEKLEDKKLGLRTF